uniref:Uncharacterized protein n=1 Tax=Octopus bimaculoides TaxID=37653 RepID=A0A0L8FM76_OCTBM
MVISIFTHVIPNSEQGLIFFIICKVFFFLFFVSFMSLFFLLLLFSVWLNTLCFHFLFGSM